uniref:RING-type domain-containing protein n=1 Tax=Kalanchoe fedtschenkoi TaxID=63787 RepID=A0A7N0UU45_KALFE
MAVQAEYASTNLIPFNLSVQDAARPRRVGEFLNQMTSFSSRAQDNNLSSRKRSRDSVREEGLNYFSLGQIVQQQPTRMVELSQLHNVDHQVNPPVSTGLKLSALDDPSKYQRNQELHFSHPASISSKEFFYDQFKKESELMDKLITAQREQLIRTLASKRLKHYESIVSLAENSYGNALKQKNAELQKAIRRNVELEQMAAQLSVSAQVWQSKAVAHESAATALQAELLKAAANGGGAGLMIQETGRKEETDDAESVHMDPDRAEPEARLCRGCRSEVASVVLLPCRHLCLCATCDVLSHACPCCRTLKQSSIQIYFS